MKNVALHNLGCKVNSYEMDVMQQMLQEKGYKIVAFDGKADIYIVNTCTVTNIADRKSRQMLHRAKKMNPEAIVVATGCYVQTGKEECLLDEAIDLAVGNNRKKDLPDILEQFMAHRAEEKSKQYVEDNKETEKLKKTLSDTTIINIGSAKEYEQMTLTATAEHTRAYIKIQDGCNQFCTYCIIPYARGRVRSRAMEDVLAEVTGLQKAGCKEVVLTGIHIASYGIDFEIDSEINSEANSQTDSQIDPGTGLKKRPLLPELIQKVHKIEGIERIRLGSLEPRILTEEFVTALSKLPKLCPHFHISLQSGCDETLQRMNRHYSTSEYMESIALLRKHFVNPAITTDVIVGFPGETEKEFVMTKEFLQKAAFFEMHIFQYSKRKGTKAAVMENQVPDTVKKERSNELLSLEQIQSKTYRASFVGKNMEILFEEAKIINGAVYQIGHSKEYIKAAVKTEKDYANQIFELTAMDFLTEDILLMSTPNA